MRQHLWIIAPAGLASVAIIANVLLAVTAFGDPSFAVEEDYYQKAVDWDEELAERRQSAALGWTVALSTPAGGLLRADITDKDGAAVIGAHVEVVLFHYARASERNKALMKEVAPGRYGAAVPMERAGWWEARLRARLGDQTFATTQGFRVPAR